MTGVSSTSQKNSCYSETSTIHSKNHTPFETIRKVCMGTAAGVFVRYFTMPLEVVFVKRSFHDCTKSYKQLFRDNVFNREKLCHLQTEIFTRTCLFQSVYKSFSNYGVITLVENTYPDLAPSKKGGLVISLSTLSETIFTTPGEWNKTLAMQEEDPRKKAKMFNAYRIKNLISKEYHRCLRATFIRSSWSSFFTYGGIYSLEACIKPFYPEKEHSAAIKVISSVFGSMLPQFIIMPGVNWQTYVFGRPDLPWEKSIKQYLADYKVEKITDVYKLFRGFELRAIHRGCTYGLAFLFAEILKAKGEKT